MNSSEVHRDRQGVQRNRWRHVHTFQAKSGHWGISTFVPSEREALSIAELLREALATRQREARR